MLRFFLSQAEVTRLVSQLRFKVKPMRHIRNPQHIGGSLEKLQKSVTALISHERLELGWQRGFLTRQYTEKLIGDAILYGDKHTHTMEMASWWLENVSFPP